MMFFHWELILAIGVKSSTGSWGHILKQTNDEASTTRLQFPDRVLYSCFSNYLWLSYGFPFLIYSELVCFPPSHPSNIYLASSLSSLSSSLSFPSHISLPPHLPLCLFLQMIIFSCAVYLLSPLNTTLSKSWIPHFTLLVFNIEFLLSTFNLLSEFIPIYSCLI